MGRQPPIVIPLRPVLGDGPWLAWLKHELADGPLAPDVSLALHRCIDESLRLRDAPCAAGAPPPAEGEESR